MMWTHPGKIGLYSKASKGVLKEEEGQVVGCLPLPAFMKQVEGPGIRDGAGLSVCSQRLGLGALHGDHREHDIQI